MLCSRELKHVTSSQWTDDSDHCAIVVRLSLPGSRPGRSHLIFPVSAAALEICRSAERSSHGLEEFLRYLQNAVNAKKHVRRVRVTLRERHPQEHTLPEFADLIDGSLRTSESKRAFRLISRLAIVHPSRRDGGIMI